MGDGLRLFPLLHFRGVHLLPEGQQSVGGLGAAVALSLGRTEALQQRGGHGVDPRCFLLHLLLNVVLYDVAVVVLPHPGRSRGTTEDGTVCKQPRNG
ncbi:hypothetical protein GOODEAATRI_007661 [Goodea atripinnis]|uniref:Uncharacterized protein n=1 Tax=Goodea atripinnis TaxID=208336 RepID=A0ABV0N0B3_9TELE